MPAGNDPPIQHRIVREPDRLGTMASDGFWRSSLDLFA